MQNLDCLVSRSPRASGASRGSIRTAWAASGRLRFLAYGTAGFEDPSVSCQSGPDAVVERFSP